MCILLLQHVVLVVFRQSNNEIQTSLTCRTAIGKFRISNRLAKQSRKAKSWTIGFYRLETFWGPNIADNRAIFGQNLHVQAFPNDGRRQWYCCVICLTDFTALVYTLYAHFIECACYMQYEDNQSTRIEKGDLSWKELTNPRKDSVAKSTASVRECAPRTAETSSNVAATRAENNWLPNRSHAKTVPSE